MNKRLWLTSESDYLFITKVLTLTKSQLFSYRLTTEQSSGFVKLVKGFAYAEEFTCSPPTVFMLAITALQGLNHTFGGI